MLAEATSVSAIDFTRYVTASEPSSPSPPPLPSLTLKTQGLIRIDGDRMTYIVSNPDGPRPTNFETTPGPGWSSPRIVDSGKVVYS